MRWVEVLEERIRELHRAGRFREPDADPREASPSDGRGGAQPIDFTSNDYLGLAAAPAQVVAPRAEGAEERGRSAPRPRGRAAAASGGGAPARNEPRGEALGAAGLGAASSRLIRGTHPAHARLEASLASWLGLEGALLFSSGYAANVGTLSALSGEGDVVLSDALNHASIIDGCRLGRGTTRIVAHRDLGAFERELRAAKAGRGATWVVTESYFSMDGDSPDLGRLGALCAEHGAGLIVDEAHALGVFGPEGRGLSAEVGVRPDVLVGGLGKAFGAQGGFVAGAEVVRTWLWNRARSFVFSTGVSPALCEALLARLQQVRGAEDARARLRRLEALLGPRLRDAGLRLPEGQHGPIVPVIVGDEQETLRIAGRLAARGYRAQAIRPPTVRAGSSRLRLTLHAGLSSEAVEGLATALVSELGATAGSEPGAGSGEAAPRAAGAAALGASVQTGSGSPRTSAGEAERRAEGTRRWVVLGAGTGVGKTFVAEGLARSLAGRGVPTAALKPIETGLAVGGPELGPGERRRGGGRARGAEVGGAESEGQAKAEFADSLVGGRGGEVGGAEGGLPVRGAAGENPGSRDAGGGGVGGGPWGATVEGEKAGALETRVAGDEGGARGDAACERGEVSGGGGVDREGPSARERSGGADGGRASGGRVPRVVGAGEGREVTGGAADGFAGTGARPTERVGHPAGGSGRTAGSGVGGASGAEGPVRGGMRGGSRPVEGMPEVSGALAEPGAREKGSAAPAEQRAVGAFHVKRSPGSTMFHAAGETSEARGRSGGTPGGDAVSARPAASASTAEEGAEPDARGARPAAAEAAAAAVAAAEAAASAVAAAASAAGAAAQRARAAEAAQGAGTAGAAEAAAAAAASAAEAAASAVEAAASAASVGVLLRGLEESWETSAPAGTAADVLAEGAGVGKAWARGAGGAAEDAGSSLAAMAGAAGRWGAVAAALARAGASAAGSAVGSPDPGAPRTADWAEGGAALARAAGAAAEAADLAARARRALSSAERGLAGSEEWGVGVKAAAAEKSAEAAAEAAAAEAAEAEAAEAEGAAAAAFALRVRAEGAVGPSARSPGPGPLVAWVEASAALARAAARAAEAARLAAARAARGGSEAGAAREARSGAAGAALAEGMVSGAGGAPESRPEARRGPAKPRSGTSGTARVSESDFAPARGGAGAVPAGSEASAGYRAQSPGSEGSRLGAADGVGEPTAAEGFTREEVAGAPAPLRGTATPEAGDEATGAARAQAGHSRTGPGGGSSPLGAGGSTETSGLPARDGSTEGEARARARRAAPAGSGAPGVPGPESPRSGAAEPGSALTDGRGSAPPGSDAARLAAASFHVKPPERHPLYAFEEPLTPALAARRAHRELALERVRPWVDAVRTLEGRPPTAVIVETAGGVFSPITEAETNFELAQAMEPAVWVLVAADRLGVLHELGGCLRAMRALGRLPDWIVLSAPEHADVSTGTNAAEVERLGFGVPVVVVPRDGATAVSRIVFEREGG